MAHSPFANLSFEAFVYDKDETNQIMRIKRSMHVINALRKSPIVLERTTSDPLTDRGPFKRSKSAPGKVTEDRVIRKRARPVRPVRFKASDDLVEDLNKLHIRVWNHKRVPATSATVATASTASSASTASTASTVVAK
jgi:hypothetical protein